MATDLLNLFSEQNVAAGIYDDGFYRVADDLRRGGWFWIALSNTVMVWTTRGQCRTARLS
jgi:hypothetical protein